MWLWSWWGWSLFLNRWVLKWKIVRGIDQRLDSINSQPVINRYILNVCVFKSLFHLITFHLRWVYTINFRPKLGSNKRDYVMYMYLYLGLLKCSIRMIYIPYVIFFCRNFRNFENCSITGISGLWQSTVFSYW